MSGTLIEQILGQTRAAVAISGQQVLEIAKMPQTELCALLVVLSRWYANAATAGKLLTQNQVPSQKVDAKSTTPIAIYNRLQTGDQLLPDQLAAIRSWSVPSLIAFVVQLQADLVKVPAPGASASIADLPRRESLLKSTATRRRRSRRIARERWMGIVAAPGLLIALPILGETQSGRDVIQVGFPFLLGAASIWVFSQGRWMSQSRNPTKSNAGHAAVTLSAIGSLVAALWILNEVINLGMSIGEEILRYAAAL